MLSQYKDSMLLSASLFWCSAQLLTTPRHSAKLRAACHCCKLEFVTLENSAGHVPSYAAFSSSVKGKERALWGKVHPAYSTKIAALKWERFFLKKNQFISRFVLNRCLVSCFLHWGTCKLKWKVNFATQIVLFQNTYLARESLAVNE